VGDVPGLGHRFHPGELHPLNVTHDREAHGQILTPGPPPSFQDVEVTLPPFERFYEEHRDVVFRVLVRRLGRQRAEDAFQETFFRALRAYPKLRHADNLRGWVLTIAERIAIDMSRAQRHDAEFPELESVDELPTHGDLLELTRELPRKERAAVVLRYGFDLPYTQIGAALGSSPEAARQAASSGVRRLRRKELP
jgi:RNA polymerase sigma factor (sigma-70 family)